MFLICSLLVVRWVATAPSGWNMAASSAPCAVQHRLPVPHTLQLSDATPSAQPSPSSPAPSQLYGRDPRDGLTSDEIAPTANDDEWALSIRPGHVCELSSVGQLQAVMDTSSSTGADLVVVRCVAEHCVACAQTRQLYADAAAEFGSSAIFCISDCSGVAMPLCKMAGVKAVPSVLIFHTGELAASMRLSRKDWPAFYAQLLATSQPAAVPCGKGLSGLKARISRFLRRKRLRSAAA
jgi:hypothetical protein